MAEIKGGITVSGGSVDSMPVILDGRTSLYTEAIERGLIEPDTTYEQFLERLAVKPGELKKAVKEAVAADLENKVNAAVAVAVAQLKLIGPGNVAPVQPSPQPQPEQPVSPVPKPAAKPETSVRFTFDGVEATAEAAVGSNREVKLKTVNNSIKSGEPEGWVGAFGEVDGHKVMFASAAGTDKGVRYIESDGIASDGSSDSAIIVPIKISATSSNGGAFAAVVLDGRNIVNSGLLVTDADGGFKLRLVDGTTINGQPISAAKIYEYDKWHVAVITVKSGDERRFDKVRFGLNHAGNAGRSVTIGAGLEIVQGDISKAAEKAATLMTEYGIS